MKRSVPISGGADQTPQMSLPRNAVLEFNNFNDASIEIEKAFTDYNECRLHSSIDYLPLREFRRKFLNDSAFRERFEKKEVEVKLDEN